MKIKNKGSQVQVSRRQFNKIAGTFGLTATLLGWSGLSKTELISTSEALAATASDIQKKRYGKKARFNLKLGTSQTPETLLKTRGGSLVFIADLEARTDGEIRVEFIGGNKLCNELTCVKHCMKGEIDLFYTTTQNAAHQAPYLNVLDFAYLWPSRAAQYYFFYHPESERLFREPLRKFHKLQFLFTNCQLRGIMMGQKYKDKPKIMTVDALKDTKIRVTSTQLGRITLRLIGTRPIPIAWKDTLNALKIGLVDGAETFSSACTHSMVSVVSQDIHCQLFSGNSATIMNLASYQKLGPKLQHELMESAYLTQVHVQTSSEAGLTNIIGITDPPLSGTVYDKFSVKNCYWPKSELEKAERMSSPKFNPDPWEKWRKRLNRMSGGREIFEELYAIAREIPESTMAINVEPRRWWKG